MHPSSRCAPMSLWAGQALAVPRATMPSFLTRYPFSEVFASRSESETPIEMSLTPAAYDKWGYNKPKLESASSAAKAAAYVFIVRCDVVELKLGADWEP